MANGLKNNQPKNQGGRRPGAGRPRGSRNKASVDFERLLAEKSESITAIVPGAFEGDSHAFLMSIYKDPAMPIATRMDAAEASLPYEKPRLSAVEMSGGLRIGHEDMLERLR